MPIANIDSGGMDMIGNRQKLVHRFINYLKGLNKQDYFRPVIASGEEQSSFGSATAKQLELV